MLNIDEIQNGIVIDHIKAGTAIGLMDLLRQSFINAPQHISVNVTHLFFQALFVYSPELFQQNDGILRYITA